MDMCVHFCLLAKHTPPWVIVTKMDILIVCGVKPYWNKWPNTSLLIVRSNKQVLIGKGSSLVLSGQGVGAASKSVFLSAFMSWSSPYIKKPTPESCFLWWVMKHTPATLRHWIETWIEYHSHVAPISVYNACGFFLLILHLSVLHCARLCLYMCCSFKRKKRARDSEREEGERGKREMKGANLHSGREITRSLQCIPSGLQLPEKRQH